MNGMDTDGTLTNYKRINKNDCIYFLSLGDYKATEQQTRQQIQQDASHISLVLSIDCIYRYLLYEKEDIFLHMQKTWPLSDHTLALSAVANSIITSM